MAEEQGEKEAPVATGAHSTDALKVGDLGSRQQRKKNALVNIVLPNRAVSANTMRIIVAVEIAIVLLVWLNSPFKVLPRPDEVLSALKRLWADEGLGQELMSSFMLNLQALAWSSAITLVLAYLTVLPVFRPIATGISKLRFLSLTGLTIVFTLLFGGGHPLKLSLLVFGITVFYITSMASVVANVSKAELDHARTLRMREWRVVWEVVILGTIDRAFEVLRQNAAIGWMMLTMVEVIVRSGGVGEMLMNEYKHFRLADMFAIQLVILIVGLLQDGAIVALRKLCCPYADLTLDRK